MKAMQSPHAMNELCDRVVKFDRSLFSTSRHSRRIQINPSAKPYKKAEQSAYESANDQFNNETNIKTRGRLFQANLTNGS